MLETILTEFAEEVKKKVVEFEHEISLYSDFHHLEDTGRLDKSGAPLHVNGST